MTQVGIRGPFEIPYEEGYFAPVPHNFVIVGTIFYIGFYKIVGNILFYHIEIAGDTGADTVASIAGTSYFTGIPRPPYVVNSNCFASNGSTDVGYGNGENSPPGRVYPPTWPASQYLDVDGWYFLSV